MLYDGYTMRGIVIRANPILVSMDRSSGVFWNHAVTQGVVTTAGLLLTIPFAGAVGNLVGRGLNYAGRYTYKGLSYVSKLRVNVLRASGGRVNGISITKGSGYGAKPRFDIHPLKYASTKSKVLQLPKVLKNGKNPVPHYHRRGPGGLRRHRPWEWSPGDKSWWSRF